MFVEVGGRTEVVTVDPVASGSSANWATVITARSVLDECEPDIIVNGPFPYGIEVDPVSN